MSEKSESHQNYYESNLDYASFLDNQETSFFDKYVLYLGSKNADMAPHDGEKLKVLDVGCGTGQVVERLNNDGYKTWGVEVSEPNIKHAQARTERCQLYDGTRLPFENNSFDIVGSFNVLEHVEDPQLFIAELVRVTRPGGRIVISSPNFLRVIGFRDYHQHMRSLASKFRNANRQFRKWKSIKSGQKIEFDRMEPIIRDAFEPDDDAIIATNLLEMCYFLRAHNCKILDSHCTDRIVHPLLEWSLNATPLKYLMFNAFIRSEKMS